MTQLAATGPDRAAPWFDDLFRAHATTVYRFVARRAGRDEADDLTAETFAVAWRRRQDVPEGHELPWLYRTAGFLVANHHRKRRPTPVDTLPDEADPTSVEAVVLADLEVRTAFATLGARDREVLLLAAWEGLRGEALAAALGVSRGGADAALSRARARLREAWQAAGADSGREAVAPPGARSPDPTTQTG
ncbi:sigma-70 family RNA polymerase sigma factor [Sanguibacter sp. 25GB23B1]|uniref:RNA polymerase sigma factor n=1 Tax=unclassified Sanguibacter TaxID=2645534 RepID=UPI0032AFFAA0